MSRDVQSGHPHRREEGDVDDVTEELRKSLPCAQDDPYRLLVAVAACMVHVRQPRGGPIDARCALRMQPQNALHCFEVTEVPDGDVQGMAGCAMHAQPDHAKGPVVAQTRHGSAGEGEGLDIPAPREQFDDVL